MFAEVRLLVTSAIVALGVVPAYSTSAGPCAEEPVRAAVRASVASRLGQRVEVTLDEFTCALTTNTPQALAATPDPSARTGRSVRFAITTVGVGPRGYAVRLGSATAVIRVSGQHVRAARSLAPGGTLAAQDLEVVTGALDGLALRRVPTRSDLLGARLLRGVAAGEPIAIDAVVIPPVVRSGDQVRLTVRERGVEAAVMAVAEQSASVGQVIRVVNASSHRPLRARVTAPGEVEVVNER
ncbi:MAG: flagellar basal body P-ring formation chaperone FlgA [Acidobacteriota bacterium]